MQCQIVPPGGCPSLLYHQQVGKAQYIGKSEQMFRMERDGVVLSRIVRMVLPEKMEFDHDLRRRRCYVAICGRTFQADGIASAKALRWQCECAGLLGAHSGGEMRLDCSKRWCRL